MASLGKIKDMHLKMNKTKKGNRNEISISTFLSPPFSPSMINLIAGENTSLTLGKRESFESNFLREFSEKILVCRRLYVY